MAVLEELRPRGRGEEVEEPVREDAVVLASVVRHVGHRAVVNRDIETHLRSREADRRPGDLDPRHGHPVFEEICGSADSPVRSVRHQAASKPAAMTPSSAACSPAASLASSRPGIWLTSTACGARPMSSTDLLRPASGEVEDEDAWVMAGNIPHPSDADPTR